MGATTSVMKDVSFGEGATLVDGAIVSWLESDHLLLQSLLSTLIVRWVSWSI